MRLLSAPLLFALLILAPPAAGAASWEIAGAVVDIDPLGLTGVNFIIFEIASDTHLEAVCLIEDNSHFRLCGDLEPGDTVHFRGRFPAPFPPTRLIIESFELDNVFESEPCPECYLGASFLIRGPVLDVRTIADVTWLRVDDGFFGATLDILCNEGFRLQRLCTDLEIGDALQVQGRFPGQHEPPPPDGLPPAGLYVTHLRILREAP